MEAGCSWCTASVPQHWGGLCAVSPPRDLLFHLIHWCSCSSGSTVQQAPTYWYGHQSRCWQQGVFSTSIFPQEHTGSRSWLPAVSLGLDVIFGWYLAARELSGTSRLQQRCIRVSPAALDGLGGLMQWQKRDLNWSLRKIILFYNQRES